MTEKFYTFVIGSFGVSEPEAWEFCKAHAQEYPLDDLELLNGGLPFNSRDEAETHYSIVDVAVHDKSVPMAEIKAIQDELHELVWYDNPTPDDLKAILGKLQMLTDQ